MRVRAGSAASCSASRRWARSGTRTSSDSCARSPRSCTASGGSRDERTTTRALGRAGGRHRPAAAARGARLPRSGHRLDAALGADLDLRDRRLRAAELWLPAAGLPARRARARASRGGPTRGRAPGRRAGPPAGSTGRRVKLLRAWRELRRFRNLDPAQRNLVFYSEGRQDWHHFAPILERLTQEHGRSVCYVSSDASDFAFAESDPRLLCFHIPEGVLRMLFFQTVRADVF